MSDDLLAWWDEFVAAFPWQDADKPMVDAIRAVLIERDHLKSQVVDLKKRIDELEDQAELRVTLKTYREDIDKLDQRCVDLMRERDELKREDEKLRENLDLDTRSYLKLVDENAKLKVQVEEWRKRAMNICEASQDWEGTTKVEGDAWGLVRDLAKKEKT